MRRPAKSPSGSFTVLLGATVALLVLTGCYLLLLGGTSPRTATPIGGAWTLTRNDGRLVSSQTYRGQYLLIYFGYTSCPDECPVTLAAVGRAIDRLGTLGTKVQPIFITVDPTRDTAPVVDKYVRNFGARLIGFTGTPAQIEAVRKSYGIEANFPSGTQGKYSVEHTSVLLLVDPDGRYRTSFPAAEDAAHIAARLITVLDNT